MSQSEKAHYFQALKAAGVTFDRHYREYTTDDFKAAYVRAVESGVIKERPAEMPSDDRLADLVKVAEREGLLDQPHLQQPVETDPAAASFFGFEAPSPVSKPQVPVSSSPTTTMAGTRPRAQEELEPVRYDPETGRTWYQEEVLKPAYPKPRGRRVLRKRDAPAVTKTVKMGDYTETFEVSGDPKNLQDTEVKITLPSYQVGIYKDPRFPFKVICYNGNEGFDREDIIAYYGGAELVPNSVKRKYVENTLCYDMRSVIAAIQDEARRLQLQGRW